MVLWLPPAVPPLLPPFPPIPGWMMSWKEGIFPLCSVGPSHSLSVSSESRKPFRALACSCHVTPPAKENVNFRSCSETPLLPLQRCGLRQQDPTHWLFLQFICPHTERLPRTLSLCYGLQHDHLDFIEIINEQC